MTSKQESRLNMYMVVHDFLVKNSNITFGLPDFDNLFKPFCDALTEIRKIREQQERDITGIFETKKQMKDLVVKQGADIARKISAYAIVRNNHELMNAVNYSENELARSNDNVLPERIRVIMGSCIPIIDKLGSYGVVQADLDELDANLEAYLENLPRPRLGITEHKQSTVRLGELFAIADTQLNKIDCLAAIFHTSQSEFYNLYRNNRHVIDTTRRMLSLIGTAIERQSREPVKGAEFTFAQTDVTNGEPYELIKTTSEKGSFQIKSIPCGEYTVTVSKPGYKDSVVNISVADGERTDVTVELER